MTSGLMICLFLFPFSRYNDWKKKSLFKWSVLLKYWLAYQQLMIRKNWNDTLDYNLSVLCQHSYILQFSIYLYLTFFWPTNNLLFHIIYIYLQFPSIFLLFTFLFPSLNCKTFNQKLSFYAYSSNFKGTFSQNEPDFRVHF